MANFIYNNILSDVGRAIWDSLENVDDWEFQEYKMVHLKTGISFWTSNGGFWFDGHDNYLLGAPNPPKVELGLLERHFLYNKAMRLEKEQLKKRKSTNDIAIQLLRDS